jgi:xanthine dehydrogenase YagS FAD-binding subunit
MQPFEYASPKTLKEAFALLGPQWDDAAVLAGGTDLISLMKDLVYTPKRVVSLREIKTLAGVTRAGGGVKIGALTTIEALMNDATIRSTYPALHQAARGITSPQIRNVGTVGGDLCQRPRCWYYRQGFGLLAMKDGKSLVAEGDNRYHAIFGDGPARFVSASSFGPALVALGAKIQIESAAGAREVDAAKFFLAPKAEGEREVDLKPNEIVTAIVLPGTAAKNATYEVRQKDALDWPLAAASVALTMSGNTVSKAAVVMGHVAPTPVASEAAAAALAGKAVNAGTAEAAAAAAVQGAKPLSGNAYKVTLARTAVKRAILRAAGLEA